MKIAIVSDWFAENTGYAENCLPKAIASLGHDVHVVAANVQPYWDSPSYEATYAKFLGPPVVETGSKPLDGFTLHRLPHGKVLGRLRIKGLVPALARLRPDIVQVFELAVPSTYEVAAAKAAIGYKLFLESHTHASVFSVGAEPGFGGVVRRGQMALARGLGFATGLVGEHCYAIADDVLEIAVGRLGMSRAKTTVCSLGVDTQLFREPTDDAARQSREKLRGELGFGPSEIVCVYTGRFSGDKDPVCLARAVDRLVQDGRPFRALFVGNGTAEQIAAISACRGSVVHGFVPVRDLPPYYWASDVGVWPKQESTSQLDAAACGLPLVVSDRIGTPERVDGNGLLYREGDSDDLAAQLRTLEDGPLRARMGAAGSAKVRERFSWIRIAKERVTDYERALGR